MITTAEHNQNIELKNLNELDNQSHSVFNGTKVHITFTLTLYISQSGYVFFLCMDKLVFFLCAYNSNLNLMSETIVRKRPMYHSSEPSL